MKSSLAVRVAATLVAVAGLNMTQSAAWGARPTCDVAPAASAALSTTDTADVISVSAMNNCKTRDQMTITVQVYSGNCDAEAATHNSSTTLMVRRLHDVSTSFSMPLHCEGAAIVTVSNDVGTASDGVPF